MWLIEDQFPNIEVVTTKGTFRIYDYIGEDWCIFYAHTLAFTPICTSDLAAVIKLWPEYERRNLKVLALTTSTNEENLLWQKDLLSVAGVNPNSEVPFAIIADTDRSLANRLGMIRSSHKETEAIPITIRNAFIIGPDKHIKMSMWYPDEVGRNYVEVLRIFDAIVISHLFNRCVGTPANWVPGEKCLVLPTVPEDQIPVLFRSGYDLVKVPSGKNYLKLVDYTQQ